MYILEKITENISFFIPFFPFYPFCNIKLHFITAHKKLDSPDSSKLHI